MADAFITYLINGDLLGFIVSCYTSSMGQGFFIMVLAIVFGVIYNSTKSIALCCILWLLIGGAGIVLTMELSPIIMVLVALGLTGILYKVYSRSRS